MMRSREGAGYLFRLQASHNTHTTTTATRTAEDAALFKGLSAGRRGEEDRRHKAAPSFITRGLPGGYPLTVANEPCSMPFFSPKLPATDRLFVASAGAFPWVWLR